MPALAIGGNDHSDGLLVFPHLWKFTLVNYNAGPGCLGNALDVVVEENLELNWENVSANLEPACQGAIEYVNDISR